MRVDSVNQSVLIREDGFQSFQWHVLLSFTNLMYCSHLLLFVFELMPVWMTWFIFLQKNKENEIMWCQKFHLPNTILFDNHLSMLNRNSQWSRNLTLVSRNIWCLKYTCQNRWFVLFLYNVLLVLNMIHWRVWWI